MAEDGGYRPEGIRLGTPLSRDAVRRLRTGDLVYLTGTVVTMRDRAHLRTMEEGPPTDLEGGVVYHCGPLARHDGRDWHVLAAGPTTSIRMESLAPVLLRAHRPRAIVGKGGMGPATLAALAEVGAVYLAWTGGAAVLAARAVRRVADVHWMDLGPAEAVWILEVEDLGPLVVAMDSHGGDLYQEVRRHVRERLPEIGRSLGLPEAAG